MSNAGDRAYDRRLTRHAINGAVDIYDAQHDVYLGRLVNIHTEGLMLMGDVSVDADRLYRLDLNLPQAINGRQVIQLAADCLWANSDDQYSKNWAGFHIIDLSPEATGDIESLIAELGTPTDS